MRSFKGYTSLVSLGVFLVALAAVSFMDSAQAAPLTSRKLTLVAGAGGDGGSKPSGVVKHQFDFTIPTSGNIGSIKFQYCTIASGTCDLPTGVSTTAATLEFESGVTGFTLNRTTNGVPFLTRTAALVTGPQNATFRLAAVTNPSATNQTFFVRISTYASVDTTGSPTDSGTVAASTANQITLTGIMPESLVFCTGATISLTGGVPDCSTATPGNVNFDRLFSPTDTSIATSQLAASTNAGFGYAVGIYGTTLTSGSNTIPAMNTATAGTRGVGQFGMNFRANTTTTSTPAVGSDPAPASNGTNYKGQGAPGYDSVDTFKFTSGDTVANSAFGGTASATDAQLLTSSYIVNVSGSQAPGTYTTTLTYVCTPTF